MVQPVSTAALLQAMQNNRRPGMQAMPKDPYGIASGLGAVGQSYMDLNKQVQAGNETAANTAATNAQLESGYYPAAAAMSTAQFNKNAATAKQQQMEMEDLQQAVTEAKAAGKVPGTPEFYQYVQSHVNTVHGMRAMGPEMAAATKQAQNQQMQKAFLEDQIPTHMAVEMAKKMYPQLAAAYEQRMGTKLDPNSFEAKQIWQGLIKEAVDNVQASGLKVDIDPVAGTITATDSQGRAQNLDPKLLASALKMGGNPAAFEVFQALFTNQRQAAATDAISRATQGKVDLQEAQAAGGGAAGKAGGKSAGAVDEISKHIIELNKSRAKLREEWAKGNIADDKYKKSTDEIDAEIKAYHQAGAQSAPSEFSLKGMYPWQNTSPPTDYGNKAGRTPGVDYAAPGLPADYGATNVDYAAPGLGYDPYSLLPQGVEPAASSPPAAIPAQRATKTMQDFYRMMMNPYPL